MMSMGGGGVEGRGSIVGSGKGALSRGRALIRLVGGSVDGGRGVLGGVGGMH